MTPQMRRFVIVLLIAALTALLSFTLMVVSLFKMHPTSMPMLIVGALLFGARRLRVRRGEAMTARRVFAAAALVVIGLTAACGSQPDTGTTPTIPPTSTPDAVAAAFAQAMADGNTPLACTYAAGTALTYLNNSGLCTGSKWGPQGEWESTRCEHDPAGDMAPYGRYTYLYLTNGRILGAASLAVGVDGAGASWHVDNVVAGPPAATKWICGSALTVTESPGPTS